MNGLVFGVINRVYIISVIFSFCIVVILEYLIKIDEFYHNRALLLSRMRRNNGKGAYINLFIPLINLLIVGILIWAFTAKEESVIKFLGNKEDDL